MNPGDPIVTFSGDVGTLQAIVSASELFPKECGEGQKYTGEEQIAQVALDKDQSKERNRVRQRNIPIEQISLR